jgi:hypothetical protein
VVGLVCLKHVINDSFCRNVVVGFSARAAKRGNRGCSHPRDLNAADSDEN